MQKYEQYMKKCFELGKLAQGCTSPNPMVGCVVLDKNGKEISTGYHKKYGENHAERDALLKLDNTQTNGGTLIVNLEPCSHFGKTPPCADLIIKKGLKKVVIAMKDVNPIVAGNGIKKLQEAGIEVIDGILEQEAKKLNEIFIKNMVEKKCFITIKTATTLDGKIATKNGSSKWITSENARKKVGILRKAHDAILTTSQTVIMDNPTMDMPTKIILDRTLKTDLTSKIYQSGKIYIATCNTNPPEPFRNELEYIICPEKDGKIDIEFLFEKLFEKGVRSIFVEAGGKLNGDLISKGLVDKIYQFIAPKILCDNSGKSCFDGCELTEINDSKMFTIDNVEMFEPDVLLTYYPAYQG